MIVNTHEDNTKLLMVLATIILVIVSIFAMSCKNGGEGKQETIAHDTIIVRDTVYIEKVKYFDASWMQQKFETCEWKSWESYDYHFVVRHPVFMQMDERRTSTSGVCFEYNGIRLLAKAYKDKVEMSVEQKYKKLSQSANTKSMKDSCFLIAGKMGEEDCCFEKDIKIDGCWYYIRAEFPQPFTSSIDALLQYVKDYDPFAFSPYVKQK